MEITEVRIKLVDRGAERLLAFCSITIDAAFVVRDLKLIDGPSGPFVAMPSRKLTVHCSGCGGKNPLRSNYCNHCGVRVVAGQPGRDDDGKQRLYADIAHPINAACRDRIQRRVVAEYQAELVRAREPAYVSRYDPLGDEDPPR
jgi:stage V sporulation protein G